MVQNLCVSLCLCASVVPLFYHGGTKTQRSTKLLFIAETYSQHLKYQISMALASASAFFNVEARADARAIRFMI